jgi:HAD superfamily hydrolase (TIGR01509 family)
LPVVSNQPGCVILGGQMQNQDKIKAIVTDLGGVLVRTREDSARERLAKQLGLSCAEMLDIVFRSPTAELATLGVIPEEQHWLAIAGRLNLKAEELSSFRWEFWSCEVPDEDLLVYLKSLKPRYRLGVLSNAWSDSEREIRARLPGLLDLFDDVIFSAQVGMAKPDVRIYRLAVERLGVQPQEAVFLDDVGENTVGACRAGLHAICVQNGEQAIAELQQLLEEQGV